MAGEMPEEPGRFRKFLEDGGGSALGSILTGILAQSTGGNFNQGATGFSRGYGRADEMIRQRQMERIQMAQEAERHKAEMEQAERAKVEAKVNLKFKAFGVLRDMGAPETVLIKSVADVWPDLTGRPMTDDDKAILTANKGQALSLFHKTVTDAPITIEDRMLANRLKPIYPEMAAEVEKVWAAQQPKGVDERERYTPEEIMGLGKSYGKTMTPQQAAGMSVQSKTAVDKMMAEAAGGAKGDLHFLTTTDPKTGEKVYGFVEKRLGEVGRSPAEAAKEPKQFQYAWAQFARDLHDSKKVLFDPEIVKHIQGMNMAKFLTLWNLPEGLKDSKFQRFKQAALNMAQATQRPLSGAAITESEWRRAGEQYAPSPGIADETVLQKKQNLDTAYEQRILGAGSAWDETLKAYGISVEQPDGSVMYFLDEDEAAAYDPSRGKKKKASTVATEEIDVLLPNGDIYHAPDQETADAVKAQFGIE